MAQNNKKLQTEQLSCEFLYKEISFQLATHFPFALVSNQIAFLCCVYSMHCTRIHTAAFILRARAVRRSEWFVLIHVAFYIKWKNADEYNAEHTLNTDSALRCLCVRPIEVLLRPYNTRMGFASMLRRRRHSAATATQRKHKHTQFIIIGVVVVVYEIVPLNEPYDLPVPEGSSCSLQIYYSHSSHTQSKAPIARNVINATHTTHHTHTHTFGV